MSTNETNFWKVSVDLSNVPDENYEEIMEDVVSAIKGQSTSIKIHVGVAEEDPIPYKGSGGG